MVKRLLECKIKNNLKEIVNNIELLKRWNTYYSFFSCPETWRKWVSVKGLSTAPWKAQIRKSSFNFEENTNDQK